MYVCMWGAISRGFVVEREESRLEGKGRQAGAVAISSTSLCTTIREPSAPSTVRAGRCWSHLNSTSSRSSVQWVLVVW